MSGKICKPTAGEAIDQVKPVKANFAVLVSLVNRRLLFTKDNPLLPSDGVREKMEVLSECEIDWEMDKRAVGPEEADDDAVQFQVVTYIIRIIAGI